MRLRERHKDSKKKHKARNSVSLAQAKQNEEFIGVPAILPEMRCGDFSPDTCCLTLQLKVSVITLRRKSARRSIVYLIPYVENFQSASEQTKIAEQEILARLQIMEEEQISYKRYCLNCTRYRRSNGSPTDFVGIGF